MRRMVRTLGLAILLWGGCLANNGWCWGEGHPLVGEAVASRLPSPWKERLLENNAVYEQFLRDNHYPDSFAPLEEERWGAASLALLSSHGIKNRYALHHAESRCVVFQILVEAIRKEQTQEVFLALAALTHSLSDQAACNHEPLIQYLTYTLGREGLNVSPSLELDAGWLAKHSFSREIWEARCREITILPSEHSCKELFFQLWLSDWEGVNTFSHGVPIVEAASRWKAQQDLASGKELATHLSELGAWGVERTLEVFFAAVEFARRGERVVWESEMLPEITSVIERFIANRPIEKESLILPFLPTAGEKTPIRVAYDPTGRFQEGFFYGGDRIVAAQIAGTLRKQGFSVTVLDIREALAEGLSAKEIELLIVPAQRCSSYHGLQRERWEALLQSFQTAGGKILWVGGIPPQKLAPELVDSWRMSEEKDRYASPAYPVSMDVLLESSIGMCGLEKSWRYCKIPQGTAGWFWPSGRIYLDNPLPEEAECVVELRTPNRNFTIGLVLPSFGFVTSYALFPYVLTEEQPQLAPLSWSLDSAGETILLEMLQRMEVVQKPSP